MTIWLTDNTPPTASDEQHDFPASIFHREFVDNASDIAKGLVHKASQGDYRAVELLLNLGQVSRPKAAQRGRVSEDEAPRAFLLELLDNLLDHLSGGNTRPAADSHESSCERKGSE